MFRPKGYHVPSGYVGFLSDGRKMFFATEQDYMDYVLAAEDLDRKAG